MRLDDVRNRFLAAGYALPFRDELHDGRRDVAAFLERRDRGTVTPSSLVRAATQAEIHSRPARSSAPVAQVGASPSAPLYVSVTRRPWLPVQVCETDWSGRNAQRSGGSVVTYSTSSGGRRG